MNFLIHIMKHLIQSIFGKHEKHKEGTLTVTKSGVASINVGFKPSDFKVFFLDKENFSNCSDDDKDYVHVLSHKKHTFILDWFVSSPRTIKWIAKK